MMKSLNITSKLLKNIPKRYQFLRTMSSKDDVLLEDVNGNGLLTLNRPKALNALNLSMIQKIHQALSDWESKKNLVVVKGVGSRAFCAGGDVKTIASEGMSGNTKLGQEFFSKEYTTNALIGSYRIPYISIIDGIVMGGGVGLSVHGPFRIATERTIFAMPETQIGLFPDVGGSYFLPRLKGKLGLYLAMTGHRLTGVDVFHAGIATHLCPADQLADVEKALLNCKKRDDVEQVLDKFHSKDIGQFSLEPNMKKINYCFEARSVEEIMDRLRMDKSEWATNTLATLEKMSPTSLKVTLKELNLGSKLTLIHCLAMEYRLAYHCLKGNDFFEGVRALLIDKDQRPVWDPPTLADVTDELVDQQFVRIPEEQEILKHKL